MIDFRKGRFTQVTVYSPCVKIMTKSRLSLGTTVDTKLNRITNTDEPGPVSANTRQSVFIPCIRHREEALQFHSNNR